MNVGERLRNLRIKAKKTLREQSENFDVSINSIYRWEHGLAAPREAVLRKMAEYYKVPLEWLLHGNMGNTRDTDDLSPHDQCIEQQLLRMFRKLSDTYKYKILGYVERVYVEAMDQVMHLSTTKTE